jgi:hypothetical protein
MTQDSDPKEPGNELKRDPEVSPETSDSKAPETKAPDGSPAPGQDGVASPSGEPEGKKEPQKSSKPPKNKVPPEIEIDSAKAKKIDIAGEIKNIYNYLPQQAGGATVRRFSVNDCWQITEDKEDEIARLFVADVTEIEIIFRRFTEKRLLVIGGEPETGKATTAIYLGKRLAEVDPALIKNETYVVQALERQVQVDLRELCADDKLFGKRLVIFEDALSRGNADLLSFFARLNRGGTDISDRLRKNDSFLIFTVQSGDLGELQRSLAETGLFHKLSAPGRDLLERGLEARLQYLAERLKIAEAQMQMLRDSRHLVLNEFKTMPPIARFVEYYFREIVGEGLSLAPEEAIRRFKDITYWFLKDLANDFEAWCFALALCLAHCAPDACGLPWMEFKQLWRALATGLKNDPELFPPRPPDKEVEPKPHGGISSLSEALYLEKCRAEIIKDSISLADTVRFCDAGYTHEIWKALLGQHRRILTALLPQLRQMAETGMDSHEFRSRMLAAQIIGRIGEIDPERITFTMMERWIQTSERRLRSSVGYLYRGALSSADERYRELCLNRLKTLSAPASDDEDEKDRLLTAIATYTQIGVYDLHQAMRELQQIAARRLEPTLRNTHRIERLLERVEDEFDQPLYADEAIGLLLAHEMLRDLAYRLYANEGGVFLGMQFAIIALCHATDPLRVCKELRTWVSSSRTMGALVALMFLQEGGIASQLEVSKIAVPTRGDTPDNKKPVTAGARLQSAPDEKPGSDRPAEEVNGISVAPHMDSRSNPIVQSITASKDAVGQMARFLAGVYESVSTRFILPGKSQRHFQHSFLQHLKTWVIDALPITSCRMSMEALMVELLQIQSGKLYDPIYQLLNDKDFRADAELKAFADAVIRRV